MSEAVEDLLKAMGKKIDLNSYTCVFDIIQGLDDTIFEEISIAYSTNKGIEKEYLPKDSTCIVSCLERYKTPSWKLKNEELKLIDVCIEFVSGSTSIGAMLELLFEIDNPHLEHNTHTIINMYLKDGDSEERTKALGDLFDTMSQMEDILAQEEDDILEQEEDDILEQEEDDILAQEEDDILEQEEDDILAQEEDDTPVPIPNF